MSEQNPPPAVDPMDPARTLFRWFIWVLVAIAIVMIITTFLTAALKALAVESTVHGTDTVWLSTASDALNSFNTFLNEFLRRFWDFLQPLLTIAVLLMIVDWFLRRLGIRFTPSTALTNINVQAAIALLVIGSLALASFISKDTAEPLKELSLVVVGFYFGSRSRPEGNSGRMRVLVASIGGPERDKPDYHVDKVALARLAVSF
jgi:hypothetical protein